MSGWLDPVRDALDGRQATVSLFIRDDDAGWRDDHLFRLLDVIRWHDLPIDLAAIPAAVGAELARELRADSERSGGRISVHQHGFTHESHEFSGRKSEFGPARTKDQQYRDIAVGRQLLEDALGTPIPPIFTPPWNRCTAATAECLAELGFRVLSCDVTAPVFRVDGLAERPVHLDWTGRRGARLGPEAWGRSIADCLAAATTPIGLMLHHAVMSADDRRMLADLLALLRRHPHVSMRPMAAFDRVGPSRQGEQGQEGQP